MRKTSAAVYLLSRQRLASLARVSIARIIHRLIRCAMIAGCVLIYSSGCTSASDRYRAQAIARAQSHEAQAGTLAFQQFLSASDVILSTDPEVRNRVLRVFVPLVEAGKRSQFGDVAKQLPWEYVVIRNDQKVTGLAFSSGKICLYTGLVAAAETDDQLAAAVGHLVAKVLTRHQAENISRNFMKQADADGTKHEPLGPRKSEELEKTWRQTQREEADYVGMLLSADAGYDPRGAIALYKRLEGPDSARSKQLERRLPEAMARFKAARSDPGASRDAPR
jgi:metalloendopeptidase OMA1, mitochondrial